MQFLNWIKLAYPKYIWLFIGSLMVALAVNTFMVPNKLAPGGLSGLATIIYYISNQKIPVGATMFLLNIPLFIASFKLMGNKFTMKTFFGAALVSIMIDITSSFCYSFAQSYMFNSPQDLLLKAILGGLTMGTGLGLVFRAGATTGGTDLAARLIHHSDYKLTIGQVLFLIDISIVLTSIFTFKNMSLGMYSAAILIISSKSIDAIVTRVNFAKMVLILSDKPIEVAKRIVNEMDNNVTMLSGVDTHNSQKNQIVLSIMHKYQLAMLKKIIKEEDPKAIVILADTAGNLGDDDHSHVLN